MPSQLEWNSTIQMTTREQNLEILRRNGQAGNDAFDLWECALALAGLDRPETDPEPYRAHLGELVEAVRAASGRSEDPAACAEALRRGMFAGFGYAGDDDTYDDMRNANLMHVIDRRKGLPVALGILCLAVARRLGWRMVGTAFPTHFLVRIEGGAAAVVIDPFFGGERLETSALRARLKQAMGSAAELEHAHYTAVGDREVAIRLENNIKLRAAQAGDLERALEVLERMILIAPGHGRLVLEKAAILAEQGKISAAIGELESFIGAPGQPGETESEASALLERLRTRLN